jgi:hypothetical protein
MQKRPDTPEDFARKQREKKEKTAATAIVTTEPAEPTTVTVITDEPSRTDLAKEEAFRRGEVALKNQAADKTWLDWMDIGVGLDIARSDAMAEAETNAPKGSAYNKVFGRWLDKHPLYRAVNDADRTRLYEVIAKRAEIEQWRRDYFLRKPNEKQRLNHPSTVLRKWKADNETPAQKKERQQPSSLFSPALKKANAKIEEQAERIKEVEQERDSACETALNELYPASSPWELAQGIIMRVDAKKARDIANAILKELDKPTPPKGGKAKSAAKKTGKAKATTAGRSAQTVAKDGLRRMPDNTGGIHKDGLRRVAPVEPEATALVWERYGRDTRAKGNGGHYVVGTLGTDFPPDALERYNTSLYPMVGKQPIVSLGRSASLKAARAIAQAHYDKEQAKSAKTDTTKNESASKPTGALVWERNTSRRVFEAETNGGLYVVSDAFTTYFWPKGESSDSVFLAQSTSLQQAKAIAQANFDSRQESPA